MNGTGDIDSGPVFMNFGAAATIVGMQTLALYGEDELSAKIRNEINAVYPFGSLPIADAFITWSNRNMNSNEANVSFLEFHLYSVIITLLLAACVWRIINSLQKHPTAE